MQAADSAAPPQRVRRKRFTRAEVDFMEQSDMFAGQRFELLDGELIDKMGQSPRHAIAITVLYAYLFKFFGAELLGCQLPMEAAPDERERSLPEPDVWVRSVPRLKGQFKHPSGDELLLAVEVSDTSARIDLSFKARLYARAGVPEYWVVNLAKRTITVHRAPEAGRYRDIQAIGHTGTVSPETKPEARIAVADLIETE